MRLTVIVAHGKAGLACRLLHAATILLLPFPTLAEDRAVVVGIGDYSVLGDGPPLDGAVADALRFRGFLIERAGFEPDQVTLLLNEEATADRITSAITDELIGRTLPGNQAVFYFAGLGTRIMGRDDNALALLAYDADAPLGRISSDLVADILDLIPDREVTVVVDAGFEAGPETPLGFVSRGHSDEMHVTGLDQVGPLFGEGQTARTVWNAARPGQPAWEHRGRGLFTASFLATMESGPITNGHLLSVLRAVPRCEAPAHCDPGLAPLSPGFVGRLEAAAFGIEGGGTAGSVPGTSSQATSYEDMRSLAGSHLAKSNAAGLVLSLSPARARIGDVVRLSITSDRPGLLLLVDVHANGSSGVIASNVLLAAGRTEVLSFRAAEPVGPGFLLGALIEGGHLPPDALLPDTDHEAIEAGRLLLDLSRQVDVLLAGASGTNTFGWSAVISDYELFR